jgi:hypothetical protein
MYTVLYCVCLVMVHLVHWITNDLLFCFDCARVYRCIIRCILTRSIMCCSQVVRSFDYSVWYRGWYASDKMLSYGCTGRSGSFCLSNLVKSNHSSRLSRTRHVLVHSTHSCRFSVNDFDVDRQGGNEEERRIILIQRLSSQCMTESYKHFRFSFPLKMWLQCTFK